MNCGNDAQVGPQLCFAAAYFASPRNARAKQEQKRSQAAQSLLTHINRPPRKPGRFIGLNRESAPDATPLLKFRHLLHANGLTKKIFDTINGHLAEKGLMMREGTIVDATLIAAPPSTKNKDGERDPEMYQPTILSRYARICLRRK